MFKRSIAKLLCFTLCFQIISFFFFVPSLIPSAGAVDADGTLNLDLDLSVSADTTSIIGETFNVGFTITNQNSSEGDGFDPGFMMVLPEDISFSNGGGLGSPDRTVNLADGRTILIFKTSELLVKGNSVSYNVTFDSSTDVELFTNSSVSILGFAGDSIYGRGTVPSGSPGGTLPGGVDVTNGGADPVDLAFPDNVNSAADIAGLTFDTAEIQFVPFDVRKSSPGDMLIGDTGTTTLRVLGNDLGPLNDFRVIDVIPNTRSFEGFIDDSAVGSGAVLYNTPGPGQVTLDLSDIDVATGADAVITYTTRALAYEIDSYSGSTILLNTGALISDNTSSTNIATMQVEGTWNDGVSTIPITATGVISPRLASATLNFAEMTKVVTNSNPIIGETIRYTISFTAANNTSYDTSGSGTYIIDSLPDGLTFSGTISSTNSGIGNPLSFTSAVTDADGDTEVQWELSSGQINAGETITVVYDVTVDGIYEGSGDTNFENSQGITNSATFYGTIADSGNNEQWGFTDPSLIGTVDTESASASITAPNPTSNKQLISILFPDATLYNSGNPLPVGETIPVGSEMTFVVSMDFPNVVSTGATLKDALPLLTGPNEDLTNISFQTNLSLQDLYGNNVPINDDDADGNADTTFNGLTLGGITPSDTAWITTSAPNNIEFDLGGGTSAKTFAVSFTTEVLPAKPSNFTNQPELPQKNVLIGGYSNDQGTTSSLGVIDAPFTIGLPVIGVSKLTSATSVSYGDTVDYTITFSNTGKGIGFLENIIDTLPDNMNLVSSSFLYSGTGATPVPNSSMTQSGNVLSIEFNTGATYPGRSALSLDDDTTSGTDESVVILNYSVAPTQDFVIIGGDSRENTISYDYYSGGDNPSDDVNRFDSPEAVASFTVDTPQISRSLISTSEPDSTGDELQKGETALFETIITLHGGTYTNASFTDDLSSVLTFLSGSVIDYDPEISFGSGIVINTGSTYTGSTISFGDVVNTSTGSKTITIRSEIRANNTGNNYNNRKSEGDFNYSGETESSNSAVNVRRTVLDVTKTANLSSADTEDSLTYTIELEHTSSSRADAYDIVITDTLPANISYVPGSLTGSSFSGSDTDLFSGTGIIVHHFPDDNSTLSFTFNATVGTGVIAGSTETNTVNISYDSLTADDSPFEQDGSDSVTRDIMIKDASILHSISATNNSDTQSSQFSGTNPDIAIGEELTYRLEVAVPKLNISNFTVTQSLPSGINFLTGSIVSEGVTSVTSSGITISPDNIITFDFGDIENVGAGSGTGFILETQAVVTNSGANNAGDVKNSSANLSYDTTNSKTDTSPNFDVVEPNLTISKVYTPDTGDAGDTLNTQITIQNSGTAPVYGVIWDDTLAPKTSTGAGYLASSSTGVLLPGESITYSYNTILDAGVIYGETLEGTGSVSGSSGSGAVTHERVYSNTTTDSISIVGVSGLSKVLSGSTLATIGDSVSYSIQMPIPEGTTNSITLTDLVPEGLEILSGSVNISTSTGVTYSGSVTPSIGTQVDGNEQSVVYSFIDIVNTNSDNGSAEYISIEYDTVVLNTSDNSLGDSKASQASANYNSGTTTLVSTPASIIITEPQLTLNLVSSYTYGNSVVYTYTLTNSGTSTAYDIEMNSQLPTGLTYTGSFTLTNTGASVGLSQSGTSFIIDSLGVNTGSPLQFTIEALIDNSVDDMDNLMLSASGTYTSQSGNYSSLVSNSNNSERIGGATPINDYDFSNTDTFTVLLPILEQSISVVDTNVGPGIRGDIFEYTVTLTNTGSVNLNDISVNIDIPNSFTGFTVSSIPTGANNLSNATGGLYDAGELIINNIDILIGQTTTIVYQVQAKDNVVSNSLITTSSLVSDSSEGALGGTGSVDVTILASSITLTKTVSGTSFNDPVQVGDTISYGFVIENTGDTTLTGVTLNDVKLGGDITSSCSFPSATGVLTPSQTGSCSPSNYSIDSTDILRGYVENSATVTSLDASGNDVDDISDAGNETVETLDGTGSGDLDPTNDPTIQTLIQDPRLSLIKTISATTIGDQIKSGDTIDFSFVIRNNGNIPISGITLTDDLLGGDITSSCTFPVSSVVGLDVGESANCTPATYEVQNSDLSNTSIQNSARVDGLDALSGSIFDISDAGDEGVETPDANGVTDGDPSNDPTFISYQSSGSSGRGGVPSVTVSPYVNSGDDDSSDSADNTDTNDEGELSEEDLTIEEQSEEQKETEIIEVENSVIEPLIETEVPKLLYIPREYDNEKKIPTCGLSIVNFSDIEGHTFERYIISMEQISGLNGNGSGQKFDIFREKSALFEPNRETTKSEFIKMIFRSLCIDYSDENDTLNNFIDEGVDSWQAKVANKAARLGWISTDTDYFNPNIPISRDEAISIIVKAGVASLLPQIDTQSFVDVNYNSSESKFIEAAYSFGIIHGQEINGDLHFRPKDPILRGEATKLIMNTLVDVQ